MARRLTLADISHLPYPGTAVPASIQFSPDSSALTYLHSEEGTLVRSLWWHDLRSNERRVIAAPLPETADEAALSLEEHLRRERTRTSELGVTDYAWAAAAPRTTLLVPLGGHLLLSRDGGPAEPLDGISGVSAAAIAPDGSRIAYVVDGDLWMTGLDGGQPRRLTIDAKAGVTNGLADYAAAEELERFDGMWWSHDGGALAFAHVDERNIPLFIIAHLGSEQPQHEEHRYPFAGGPNAEVSLRVIGADATEAIEVPLDIGDGYLARVVAHRSGGWLVAVLPRDQQTLRWLRVTSTGEAHALWVEAASPWINLDHDTRVLADGRILRSTERSGFRHLELRGADGGQGPTLTTGDWMVTGVVHVDEGRGQVLFTGTADGAVERHLYAVSLDASTPVADPERLTTEPGWHDAVISNDGSIWVDTWSTNEHSPQVVLRRRGGTDLVLHAATESAESRGMRAPELFELTGSDGSTVMHAALYRPSKPASSPPPCVVWVYGGPHFQNVTSSWYLPASPEGLRHYLAQCGVAVVMVDSRGSANRGLAFEGAIAGHLGSVEVADQAAAVQQMAERGEIDGSRVAITGTSYGGFMTLMCLIQRPDLFKAGVAVAPVTDQAGYDTAYTERYLGNPNAEPAAYHRSSPLPRAAELPESLLLIHGAIDENVHFRHSVRLVAALQAAGRQVELVVLPGDRHRTRTPGGVRTRDARTVAHLLSHLGVPLPDELRHLEGTSAIDAG